jgi:hypothetical protein
MVRAAGPFLCRLDRRDDEGVTISSKKMIMVLILFQKTTPQYTNQNSTISLLACRVLQGVRPVEILEQVAAESAVLEPIAEWVRIGMASRSEDTRSAILRFGQMCKISAAFPATIHLIAAIEDRLEEGLIQNVMAGRGLLAGLVLGAWGGRSAIPERWLSGLAAADEINRLLDQIEAGRR